MGHNTETFWSNPKTQCRIRVAEPMNSLAPLSRENLVYSQSKTLYAKHIDNAQAICLGYGSETDYPQYENLAWLRKQFNNFFYSDPILVDRKAQ